MADSIVLFSFIWLILILILSKKDGIEFFGVFFPFLFSETYSLNLHKNKSKIQLVDVTLGTFFLIQFSLFTYLVGVRIPILPDNFFIQYVTLFGLTIIFHLCKLLFYLSLKPLLPNPQVVHYFGFNYSYWCFYLGLILFLTNLIIRTNQFSIPSWLPVIFLIGFYLFLVIRLIGISLRYNLMKSIYILLYFCALEIAPVSLILIGYLRFLNT